MADPISLGITLGTTALGSVLGAVGAKQTGDAQAAMYRYQAGVAQINQRLAKQNVQWALESGDISAEEQGLKAGQNIAETKVSQAASGFDVNTGTATAVRSTQESVASFDQGIIRWDAAKTAYGYDVKAATDAAESQMDLQAASQAQKAGWLGALTSIVGGATGVSGKWMQAKQIGMVGGGGSGVGFSPFSGTSVS